MTERKARARAKTKARTRSLFVVPTLAVLRIKSKSRSFALLRMTSLLVEVIRKLSDGVGGELADEADGF